MARKHSTQIRKNLNRLVPKKRLEALAKETGAVQRQKKVEIVPLFWTLVLGFAAGKERTLAALRRAYGKATGTTLAPSSFYDRFTAGLVKLMKAVLGDVIGKAAEPSRSCGAPWPPSKTCWPRTPLWCGCTSF